MTVGPFQWIRRHRRSRVSHPILRGPTTHHRPGSLPLRSRPVGPRAFSRLNGCLHLSLHAGPGPKPGCPTGVTRDPPDPVATPLKDSQPARRSTPSPILASEVCPSARRWGRIDRLCLGRATTSSCWSCLWLRSSCCFQCFISGCCCDPTGPPRPSAGKSEPGNDLTISVAGP